MPVNAQELIQLARHFENGTLDAEERPGYRAANALLARALAAGALRQLTVQDLSNAIEEFHRVDMERSAVKMRSLAMAIAMLFPFLVVTAQDVGRTIGIKIAKPLTEEMSNAIAAVVVSGIAFALLGHLITDMPFEKRRSFNKLINAMRSELWAILQPPQYDDVPVLG